MPILEYLREILNGDVEEKRPESFAEAMQEYAPRDDNPSPHKRAAHTDFGQYGTDDISPLEFLEHTYSD